MNRPVRFAVLALFVLATLSMTPTVQALPRDWWIDTYYDCYWNVVGYHYFSCSAGHTIVGQQTGAFKDSYQEECSTGNPVGYWVWYNNGGTWVPYTGQTCP
jgi:hypothetical protein